MSRSQVLEKTIKTLEKELQTLKKLKSSLAKETGKESSGDSLRGIWKGLNITDREIGTAKKELNF